MNTAATIPPVSPNMFKVVKSLELTRFLNAILMWFFSIFSCELLAIGPLVVDEKLILDLYQEQANRQMLTAIITIHF